jgi:hypothetical protein
MRLQMRLVTYKYRVTRTFEKDARFHASAWCEALSKIMMILSVTRLPLTDGLAFVIVMAAPFGGLYA